MGAEREGRLLRENTILVSSLIGWQLWKQILQAVLHHLLNSVCPALGSIIDGVFTPVLKVVTTLGAEG